MISKTFIYSWQMQIVIGIVSGVTISIIDNFAFEGEVSPIVIVLLLVAVSAIVGFTFGWRGLFAVSVMWLFVPAAHLVKYVFGLPDTLHPNTLNSIFKLAVFSFSVTAISFTCVVLARRFIKFNSQ